MFKGYAQTIHEATGVTNENDLADIEDSMRHDIFHSTLDWQTKAQLKQGAREAWALVQFMRSSEGQAEIAKILA